MAGGLVVAALMLAVGAGCRPEPPRDAAAGRQLAAPRLRSPAPLENRAGVIGGPRDETSFEFEPEPPGELDQPPVLDGVPAIPEALRHSLAPYLETRRARVASTRADGSLLVLSRLGEVTQLYAVATPGGARRQLTFGPNPVEQAAVVPNRSNVLYLRRDRDGDERYQIYRLEPGSNEALLTDGQSRHGTLRMSNEGLLAFSSNQRDPASMDVYLVPDDGARFQPRRVVARGGQWIAGSFSRDGRRLAVRQYLSADESRLHLVDVATGRMSPLPIASRREGVVYRDARFSADGRLIYFTSDFAGDFIELYELDPATGEAQPLTRTIAEDVELIALSPDGRLLAFATNDHGVNRVHVLELESRELRRLPGIPTGVVSTLHFAGRGSELAFTLATSTTPSDAFVYDLERETLTRWTDSEIGGLSSEALVAPSLVRFQSFDRLPITAYHYRPRGAGPFPVLIWVHGGPEAQHRPAFDPIIQYWLSRGVAVVAPNVRGSDGFGRRFRGLDNGARRLDAVRDIGALLDWIGAQPELDPSRVGIHGASYGGYMVLASLVEYGDRIVAGSNVVGISNFVTFLENTGPYRRDQRRAEYGDERDPEMRAFLTEISPVNEAHRIRSALLVAHGANDPRVPAAEAEQIVSAVREAGGEVWYLLARDEGHGFRKRRSRDALYFAMALFFERHLLAHAPDPAAE